MKKILLLLILVPLFLLMLIMASISIAPQSLLAVVNRSMDSVEVQARELHLSWFPLQVQSEMLSVAMPGLQIDGRALFVELDWAAWYAEEPFWMLRAQRLAVTPEPAQAAPPVAQQGAEATTASPLPLQPILNFTEVAVDEFQYGDLVSGSLQLGRRAQSLSMAANMVSGAAAGAITLQAQLLDASSALALSVEQGLLEITVGEQPARQLQLGQGAITWQPTPGAFDVALALDQTDLQVTGQLLADGGVDVALDLASVGLPDWVSTGPFSAEQVLPFTLQAQLRALPESVSVSGLQLVAPTNQLNADVELSLGEPLGISGQLEAQQLFVPLAPPAAQSPAESEPAAEAQVEAEAIEEAAVPPLFSAEPLDWSWLQQLEVDFNAHAERLLVQAAEFTNLQVRVLLQDGVLAIKPLSGEYGQGGFGGEIRVAAREKNVADVSVTYSMRGVTLEEFGIMPPDELQGGALDASLRLVSRGASAADLAGALNGQLALEIGATTLANNLLDLAGSDLLLEALNRLNPFRQQDPQTLLQCGVLHFVIEDGVMSNKDKLVVETGKMRIEGQATIDLSSEDLDMSFTPRAKGGFGVGMGNLVKFVKLGGTLRSPAMEMDAAGLLQSGAAVGAALSTGGVSLLAEGLARRALGDSGCAQQAVERVLEQDGETDQQSESTLPPPARPIDTENT